MSWPYRFRRSFLDALRALYSLSTSQVQMSAFQSYSFPMSNGTKQGCPLSPFLFILCLEPLAVAIRTHPNIKGVLMRQREYKLSLFADDLLLTLTNPLLSLPSLHDLLSAYGSLSGYKVNMSKNEALPVLLPPDLLSTLQKAYPYRWCSSSLKYLGVQLTSMYSSLFYC